MNSSDCTLRIKKIRIFFFRDVCIHGVPGVKVATSGVTSLGDAESKTSYTHGSNSQRFRSYEVWKKLERKEEHCAFIEKYS